MINNMISLCYVSHIEHALSNEQITHLLKDFRLNNARLDVSGLLLYNGANTFFQILEGDADTVNLLYRKIRADDRHTQVTCLVRAEIIERSFAEWRMGFRNLSNIAVVGLEGFSDFMKSKTPEAYLEENTQFVDAMIQHFKKQSRFMASNKQASTRESHYAN